MFELRQIAEAKVGEDKPMTVRQPRYSKEEFARRGNEIYEAQLKPQIEADYYGKIVAIDIETGAFAIVDDVVAA
jgi:hypothetical protein